MSGAADQRWRASLAVWRGRAGPSTLVRPVRAGPRLAGPRSGRRRPWLRRRPAGPRGRRAVRQERRQAPGRRRAQSRARVAGLASPCSAPAAAAGDSEIRRRPPAPGAKLSPGDVKAHPGSPALRRRPRCGRSSCSSRPPTGNRSSPRSTTPTSKCPPRSPSTARPIPDVGVHFRGASSYFMVPEGRKRSLNLSLDFVHGKQALGGYRTLNLLNANGDPTFLRAVLYTQIASHYIPDAEDELRARGDQRRELGHLRERAAVQQGLHARLLRHHEGRALEGAGQPRAAAPG